VIGDSPQLLTHYYDDARTMYEVFRRGFSISGESAAMGTPASRDGDRWRTRQCGGSAAGEAQSVEAGRVREPMEVWEAQMVSRSVWTQSLKKRGRSKKEWEATGRWEATKLQK